MYAKHKMLTAKYVTSDNKTYVEMIDDTVIITNKDEKVNFELDLQTFFDLHGIFEELRAEFTSRLDALEIAHQFNGE